VELYGKYGNTERENTYDEYVTNRYRGNMQSFLKRAKERETLHTQ
tara:strand:+ start:760 stop:894 length:135 start_codon:yes stop_codon:yes gene_type:complete